MVGLFGLSARSSRPISAAKALASRRPTARSCQGASLVETETDHMAKKHTARCACGAVKFEFDTNPTFVAVCHCLDCKKSPGGEAAMFFGVPEDDFTLISGEPKAFHYIAQSGKGLDRNFCPKCGARVFTTNLESFPGLLFDHLVGARDQLIRHSQAQRLRSLEINDGVELGRCLHRQIGRLHAPKDAIHPASYVRFGSKADIEVT